jgi:L-aminopeptidase/D-esterase-like protein
MKSTNISSTRHLPLKMSIASVALMTKPGPLNLITDVEGITVGNAEDATAWTGTTVLLTGGRAIGGVDVRGGAPGSRETESLRPEGLGTGVDAITLSGGSVYGLDAASGALAWLAQRKIGFRLPQSEVALPIVPGAILFDIANGGDKNWGTEAPYRRLAMQACDRAGKQFALGNAGAGYGAVAGAYKGGLGSASAVTADGYTVGALAAVNAFGSPVMPGTSALWAWAFEQNGELGGQKPPQPSEIAMDFPDDIKRPPQPAANTAIAVVATDVALTPSQARRVAVMAHDGFARSLRPVHTPVDGDIVFAVSTGKKPLAEPWQFTVGRIGSIAADCLARAVGRGVFEAAPFGRFPSYRAIHAAGFGQR